MRDERTDPLPNVRRIAVLRAGGIGDLVFALPALDALRHAYPEARITLLAGPEHRDLLAGRPGPVDDVAVVPPAKGIRGDEHQVEDPAEHARFFDRMRAERFDLGLQIHGGGRFSNPFVQKLGARLTIGLRDKDAPPLDRWVPYVYYQNEVVRSLEVVALAGAGPVTLEPRLTATETDLAESRAVAPDGPQPLVVVHPGVGHVTRQWPIERFAAVAGRLAAEGARIAVTGSEGERDLCHTLADLVGCPVEDLAGRLSLGGLAGLLSRAALAVSNDTGPLHLARAAGAATVGVFWCGNLVTSGPLTRERHRPAVAWSLACPLCGANMGDQTQPPFVDGSRCDHEASFVTSVTVEKVLANALDLLRLEEPSRERGTPAPQPASAGPPGPGGRSG